jgi:hypothetical protein
MDECEVHPAADLFPMMTDVELDVLGEDMLQNGQREPIILYKGKILDGRNRYRACLLKGIDPKFREELPADPYAFVASANLHRRHLSEEQRGMIAARLATMKQGARTDLSPSGETSQAEAAKLLKVSKRRVERSHEVIEKGVPDLADAVEQGEVSVSAAAAFVRDRSPAVQNEYIAHAGSVAEAVEMANAEMRDAESAIHKGAAKEQGRRQAHEEPQVDPATLSVSAQEKLQAAIRQHKHKLDLEFEQRVDAEIKKRIDEVVLPSYREQAALLDMIIKARKGIMHKVTYRLIWSCLHADSRKSISEERLNKAFHIWTDIELLLLDEKQSPTPAFDMPATYANLLKRERNRARGDRRTGQRRHGRAA